MNCNMISRPVRRDVLLPRVSSIVDDASEGEVAVDGWRRTRHDENYVNSTYVNSRCQLPVAERARSDNACRSEEQSFSYLRVLRLDKSTCGPGKNMLDIFIRDKSLSNNSTISWDKVVVWRLPTFFSI